jgi:HlyD family secretion protein
VIYSLDQREKLVFLIEARLDAPGTIRPGMPVDVRIAE